MHNLLLALGITIAVETVIYRLLLNDKITTLLMYSALVNGITNPLINVGYVWATAKLYQSPPPLFNPVFLTGEAIVILVEVPLIALLAKCGFKRAALVSVAANGVTASLSFLF